MIFPGFTRESFVLKVGEYQKYDVRYFSIYLGSLRFRVLKKMKINNHTVYQCHFRIDSNPSLPFVTIHDDYYTLIDSAGIYSRGFQAFEKKGKDTIYTRYNIDYTNRKIYILIQYFTPDSHITRLDSVVSIPDSITKIQDSVSLLYYARYKSSQKLDSVVHVFAYNVFGGTRIHFTGELKKFKLKQLSYNKGYFLDGKMKFVGIAGVKEDFKGWFSLDRQHIPLKAYMKAFIGKVSIQLDDWKNWEGENIYIKK